MGDIVQFKNSNLVTFSDIIKSDGYLQLSALNALDKAGYELNENGVKEFQYNNKLEVTGIIDVEDLTLLIQVFDNDKIQDIVSHLDRAADKYNADHMSKHDTRLLIAWLVLFLFFEVWGLVSFIIFIVHLFI